MVSCPPESLVHWSRRVGLNSNSSVKRLKGESRPINSGGDRYLMLASLLFVDAVTIFEDDTSIPILELIQPDIHAKGGDILRKKCQNIKQ